MINPRWRELGRNFTSVHCASHIGRGATKGRGLAVKPIRAEEPIAPTTVAGRLLPLHGLATTTARQLETRPECVVSTALARCRATAATR